MVYRNNKIRLSQFRLNTFCLLSISSSLKYKQWLKTNAEPFTLKYKKIKRVTSYVITYYHRRAQISNIKVAENKFDPIFEEIQTLIFLIFYS